MMEQDKVKYFRIKKNGRISCIMRDELLESDPVSIVLFYEKNMHIVSATNWFHERISIITINIIYELWVIVQRL